jgi:hypothetical protein
MAGPGLRGCSCALQKEATAAWTALTHLVQVSFPSPPPKLDWLLGDGLGGALPLKCGRVEDKVPFCLWPWLLGTDLFPW